MFKASSSQTKSVPAIIIGGSGYGAAELLRLLAHHPHVSVISVSSRSHAGKPISSVHSHLLSDIELAFDARPAVDRLPSDRPSVIFCALPHGTSAQTISDLRGEGLPPDTKIIDLSGDLRLKVPAVHRAAYPDVGEYAELRAGAMYGLPEKNLDQIRTAALVANPGCLATASCLPLLPLLTAGVLSPSTIVVDAKTGTSGAGRDPQAAMHHPSRDTDFTAYKVLQHRHEPEILQTLTSVTGTEPSMMFVPHLIPVSRGIFVTAYATLNSDCSQGELQKLFVDFYQKAPFVRVRENPPRLVDVIGTNYCDISVVSRARQVVVMATLDNLVKGMAGQAIQNMNLMLGFDQTLGLRAAALGPV